MVTHFLNHQSNASTFPSSFVRIGNGVFNYCKHFKRIDFASNSKMQMIDRDFVDSTIEGIKIPSSVTRICNGAFDNCNKLHYVDIQNDSKLNLLKKMHLIAHQS